jgi:hypothetical protein
VRGAVGSDPLTGRPSLPTTEREFQDAVIELARLFGWRVAHFRTARTNRGWRTPVEADGAGFPDCVLVRRPRLIFAELKSEKGRVGEAQWGWLRALSACSAETYLWRPSDWPQIEEVLKRR